MKPFIRKDPPRSKTYTIPGDPIPLARARYNGQDHFYDPNKHAKLFIAITLQSQHNTEPPFSGPLSLDATFFLPIPKSTHYTPLSYHFFKPDASNLLKMIEDAANKILYHDDCSIAKISLTKLYDKKPRTVFTISEL